MANDSESPDEVGGPAAFWILASVALAAIAQPSTGRKKETALFGGNIDLMRCIPAVCIVDIIFDVVILVKAILRLFPASEPSPHPRRALPNAAVVVVRLALTTFAVLPQIIKVFSLKGVPATQICAFIFFLATITSLMIELFGFRPEATGAASEDKDDLTNRIVPMALFLQVPFECWIWHNIGYSLDMKLSTDVESLCAWSTSSCILAMAVQILIWIMYVIIRRRLDISASPYVIPLRGFYLLLVVLRAARKPVVAEDSGAADSLTPFTSDSFSYTISLMVIAMLISITISKVLGGVGKLITVCWGPRSSEDEVPSLTSLERTTDQENDKEEDESSKVPPKGLLATWMGRIGVFPDRLVVHGLTLHSEVSVNISLTIFNLITTIFYYLVYFDGTGTENPSWTSVLG
ncbi:Ff.00g020600.m01.CDS01 [Fusarium sp. VM40]|nr:Ff.00g020600.m01.CDS01 [Fusarium sp. VM40]